MFEHVFSYAHLYLCMLLVFFSLFFFTLLCLLVIYIQADLLYDRFLLDMLLLFGILLIVKRRLSRNLNPS